MVHLIFFDVMLRRSPIAGSIALTERYRTALVREGVDGLRDGNRYRNARLRKSDTVSQILTTLGWTQSRQGPGTYSMQNKKFTASQGKKARTVLL